MAANTYHVRDALQWQLWAECTQRLAGSRRRNAGRCHRLRYRVDLTSASFEAFVSLAVLVFSVRRLVRL